MIAHQQEFIKNMRTDGYSYSKIAEILNMSINTVKSYCYRYDIKSGEEKPSRADDISKNYCKQCIKPLTKTTGSKQKRFCSDRCRLAWWNAHPEAITHKFIQKCTCLVCGQVFEVFRKRQRKYCSRTCYGKSKAVMP